MRNRMRVVGGETCRVCGTTRNFNALVRVTSPNESFYLCRPSRSTRDHLCRTKGRRCDAGHCFREGTCSMDCQQIEAVE